MDGLELYVRMCFLRHFEERVDVLYRRGLIHGPVHLGLGQEAMNLAAVWRLPVVFVCENNWYMEYTPIADVIPVALPAADRAAAYGLDRSRGAELPIAGVPSGPVRAASSSGQVMVGKAPGSHSEP
jgi:TPP-dependent pyruvate/acetoin dehydrogenase alpha subunit